MNFHKVETLTQQKPITKVKKSNVVHKGALWGDKNVLQLDYAGSYITVHIRQNSLNCAL